MLASCADLLDMPVGCDEGVAFVGDADALEFWLIPEVARTGLYARYSRAACRAASVFRHRSYWRVKVSTRPIAALLPLG
jgi:hypothetical protein